MKGITISFLAGVAILYILQNTEGIPDCKIMGFNPNLACDPYAAEEGWYSYCYVYNGRWIAYPYRCGLIDPTNSTMGYKEYTTADKKCVEKMMPSECSNSTSAS